jgi:glutamate racemase
MADIAADLIRQNNLGSTANRPPEYLFCVSDVPYRFQTIGERFLGRTLPRIEMVRL